MKIWADFLNYVRSMQAGFFVAVCIVAMLLVVLFAVLKLKRISATAAIVCSSVLCALLAFPLATSVNAFVDAKIEATDSMSRRTLLAEQKRKNAEIESLKTEIELLKSAQLSMQSMSRICEVALLETALKQIDVQKELLNSRRGAGILADTILEESLVIQTHDVNAKFGVDMQKVMVKKDGDALIISGIKSTYIGSDRNITNHVLSEIRKIESKGSVVTTTIFNSPSDKELARQKEIAAEKNFQERLSRGLEMQFMDDAVEKLAENFITAILAPLNVRLEFSRTENGEGVPVLEFLKTEIAQKNAALSSLVSE